MVWTRPSGRTGAWDRATRVATLAAPSPRTVGKGKDRPEESAAAGGPAEISGASRTEGLPPLPGSSHPVGVASSIDRTQRRVPIIGVPLAVVYKYFDDQGNYLAAVLTFYAFIAIFPLLLLASSILGFILQGYPEFEQRTLDSALAQFPIIGSELGRPGGLQGSVGAIVIGGLGALYGAVGLGSPCRTSRPWPGRSRATAGPTRC